ncbi:MAG: ATPase [Bacteroidetes bacterium]|nr:MAG: ATPase [Bacteroidota bacterium]
MTQKIAIIGPESTGKTTLARQLARHYGTLWVPEYARTYLDQLGRPYEEADLLQIARGQLALEEELLPAAHGFLFCDTHLLVIKIWSEYKYGRCHPWILEHLRLSSYRLHLLTQADLPWEFDPQREHPHEREVLEKLYRQALQNAAVPFAEIKGRGEERLLHAIEAIESSRHTA